jgi:sarcosine oxidase delta subunit
MYRLITWRRLPTKPSFREDWQLMNGCSKWCMAVDNSSIINNYHNYL